MSTERVQKILAQAGIASRRKAEELIQEGLVTINGKIAKLGDKADLSKDAIKVKGKLLQRTESPIYLALNKPKGVISALTDPQGRLTVSEFIRKIKARVFPIGQLDFNTEGLLLLTNDGAFAEQLQKQEDILRVYHVKVKGHPDAEMVSRIEKGARIGYHTVKPHSVRISEELQNKSMMEVAMSGPGSTAIKELFEVKGFLVERIVLHAIGHLTIHGMKSGEFRFLQKSQVDALLKQPELGLQRLEREQTHAPEEEQKIEERPTRRASRPVKIIPVAKQKRFPRPKHPSGPERFSEPAHSYKPNKPKRFSKHETQSEYEPHHSHKPGRPRPQGRKPSRPRPQGRGKPRRGSF